MKLVRKDLTKDVFSFATIFRVKINREWWKYVAHIRFFKKSNKTKRTKQ